MSIHAAWGCGAYRIRQRCLVKCVSPSDDSAVSPRYTAARDCAVPITLTGNESSGNNKWPNGSHQLRGGCTLPTIGGSPDPLIDSRRSLGGGLPIELHAVWSRALESAQSHPDLRPSVGRENRGRHNRIPLHCDTQTLCRSGDHKRSRRQAP